MRMEFGLVLGGDVNSSFSLLLRSWSFFFLHIIFFWGKKFNWVDFFFLIKG